MSVIGRLVDKGEWFIAMAIMAGIWKSNNFITNNNN
jgi:hypothetical protein